MCMEIVWLINIIIFIGLFFGSIFDFRKREVPDLLNFILIILGILFGLILSLYNWSVWPIVSAIVGLICGYLFGALMFYTGQWGGGDAKMLMAIGALQGVDLYLWFTSGDIPLFFTTVITIMFAGSFYGLVYMCFLIFRNFKTVREELMIKLRTPIYTKIRMFVIIFVAISCLFSILLVENYFYKLLIILIAGTIYLGMNLIFLVRVVEKVCMIKEIPLKELTEGDWILEDVYFKDEIICGPKDLGVSLEQIALLKKHKINKIKIKIGIPFIPGFLLGFILILIFGNWLLLLF